jgi:hypothetical protein
MRALIDSKPCSANGLNCNCALQVKNVGIS